MIYYPDWPIINFDPIGLEARRNPEDPEEYGINYKAIKKEVIPMFFLPRGSLKEIIEAGIDENYRRIEHLAKQRQTVGTNEEFEEFLEDMRICGRNGIDLIGIFARTTYIKLAQEGKILI